MARKFLTSLDLAQNEIQNAVAQVLGAAPSTPKTGQFYFNSASDRLMIRSSGAWLDYTARSSHSGTQLAATISDLATTVVGYRLDQFANPTSAVSFNGQRQTNVGDPQTGTDGVNRNYVDLAVQSAAASIDNKASVRLVSTSNIAALSGLADIDSVTPVANDRILLTGQTNQTQNGVYIVAAGAWSRATDADAVGEITPGAFWFVEEGALQGKTQWRCTNVGAITLGSTSIIINQWGATADLVTGNGIQATGNSWAVKPSTGITVSASGVAIDTSVVPRKYVETIGNGATLTFTITHNLNSQDVVTQVRDLSSNNVVETDIQNNGVNSVVVSFAVAPSSNSIRVVVIG